MTKICLLSCFLLLIFFVSVLSQAPTRTNPRFQPRQQARTPPPPPPRDEPEDLSDEEESDEEQPLEVSRDKPRNQLRDPVRGPPIQDQPQVPRLRAKVNPCPINESGFYHDPNQCDRYFECRKGEVQFRLCEDGFVFVISTPLYERCDFPFAVNCTSRPELQKAQPRPNCPRKNGLFPDEEDCGIYWQCSRGLAVKQKCQGELAFNRKTGICQWPNDVAGCEDYKPEPPKVTTRKPPPPPVDFSTIEDYDELLGSTDEEEATPKPLKEPPKAPQRIRGPSRVPARGAPVSVPAGTAAPGPSQRQTPASTSAPPRVTPRRQPPQRSGLTTSTTTSTTTTTQPPAEEEYEYYDE